MLVNCGCGKSYDDATHSGQCPDHAALEPKPEDFADVPEGLPKWVRSRLWQAAAKIQTTITGAKAAGHDVAQVASASVTRVFAVLEIDLALPPTDEELITEPVATETPHPDADRSAPGATLQTGGTLTGGTLTS